MWGAVLLLLALGVFITQRRRQTLRKTQEARAKQWASRDADCTLPIDAARAKREFPAPPVCLVTGGSGMVGLRLIEMLLERGAQRVVSFDLAPTPLEKRVSSTKVDYVVANICDANAIEEACRGVDTVFHVAALVGPFHPHEAFEQVNFVGTQNVIAACRACGVRRLVDCSSPSTRFPGGSFGGDIQGLGEDELAYPESYSHEYARTKALGEQAVLAAADEAGGLLTCAVAPHQVYGPTDALFLPSMLESARTGKLRVFGDGTVRRLMHRSSTLKQYFTHWRMFVELRFIYTCG